MEMVERIQYQAALTITGTLSDSSRFKLYEDIYIYIYIEVSMKTKMDNAKLIVKTELKNKHSVTNQLNEQMKIQSATIRNCTSFLLYNAVKFRTRTIVAHIKEKRIKIDEKKLTNIRALHEK